MEKWKIAVICALLLALFGYGYLQQHPSSAFTPTAPTPGPPATVLKTVGEAPPDWAINDPKEWINTPAPIRLADLKGSIALVEIFRINCPHCQEAAPLMVAIHHRYGPRGLKMVTIQSPGDYKDQTNEEVDWGKVKDWCAEKNIDYPVAFDTDSKYFQGTMHGQYYPTILILGKDGKAIFAQTGHDSVKGLDLVSMLEKMLPGPGGIAYRAADLSKWIATTPEYSGEGGPSLVAAIQGRLSGSIKAQA